MKAARRAIFAVAIVAVVCAGLGVGVMASNTINPQLGDSPPPSGVSIVANADCTSWSNGGHCDYACINCNDLGCTEQCSRCQTDCIEACEDNYWDDSCGNPGACTEWCTTRGPPVVTASSLNEPANTITLTADVDVTIKNATNTCINTVMLLDATTSTNSRCGTSGTVSGATATISISGELPIGEIQSQTINVGTNTVKNGRDVGNTQTHSNTLTVPTPPSVKSAQFDRNAYTIKVTSDLALQAANLGAVCLVTTTPSGDVANCGASVTISGTTATVTLDKPDVPLQKISEKVVVSVNAIQSTYGAYNDESHSEKVVK